MALCPPMAEQTESIKNEAFDPEINVSQANPLSSVKGETGDF